MDTILPARPDARHGGRPKPSAQVSNRTGALQIAAGQPVVSVDTKKKELVGDFKNGGRDLPADHRSGRLSPNGTNRVCTSGLMQMTSRLARAAGDFDPPDVVTKGVGRPPAVRAVALVHLVMTC